MLDDQTGTTAEVWRGLAALGATGVLVPQEFGGSGMTMVEAGVVAEELGAALHPGPWLSSAVAATRALTRLVTESRGRVTVDRHRRRIHGRHSRPAGRPASCRRERASSMATSRHCRMRSSPTSCWCWPTRVAVPGCSPSTRQSDGVCATKRTHVDPTRKLFDVTFDGVPARRLAFPSEADVQGLIDDVLIANAADALGAATAVMNLAVEYAKVRRQFDQPIGSFQAVQHLCVDMYETVELARSGVLHALWAADAAQPEERHLAAVRAKAYAGQLATVADTAIQVFGGIGYTWEHDAHLYLKRLLGWSASSAAPTNTYKRSEGTGDAVQLKGVAMTEVLRGVRVVELASWTYVPSAGAALADWGADVIKVEDVKGGDPGRALVIGGFTRENARAHVDFILEIGNRGKRSIAIDIKSDTGREYFGRLLATADVFLTNWLPAALERARLTVEDIRAFNPNIIIARGTGTGVRGPDANKGGFDAATYLSRGGVSYTLTPFGTETPAVQGPGFGDLQGGITLAGGVCAALFHRERTGEPSDRRFVTVGPGDVVDCPVDLGRRPVRYRRHSRRASGPGDQSAGQSLQNA